MSAFSDWDVYNVISEHIIEALQADAELGTSGSLEIQTWDAELRETSAEYNDNELPALAVDVVHSGTDIDPLSKWHRADYAVLIVATTGGQGVLKTAKQQAKRIASRVERVLRQQSRGSKQLSSVAADLEGANTKSVVVSDVATLTDGGVVNNVLRGAAATQCSIQIDYTPVID